MSNQLDHRSFTPIHGSHAIVEAIAYVKVDPALTSKDIRLIMDLQNALKVELPKFNIVKKFESIYIKGQDGTISNNVRESEVGVELQRIKPDGTVEWILRTDESSITMHCLDYQRWADFIEHVLKLFSVVIGKIKATESTVSSVGLKVIDNFLYQDHIESYRSDELFKKNDYLTNHCFNVQEKWHCHTGWFEKIPIDDGQCLNQLNIDALDKMIEGKKTPVTSIDHNVVIRCQGKKSITLYALIESENGSSLLEKYLTELHRINKNVLFSLLNPDMTKRINLQPSQ